jgi:imidazolonepropionase-like amidohydrolase
MQTTRASAFAATLLGAFTFAASLAAQQGAKTEESQPAGATTVDVSGKTIVPGLVDAHWHGPMGEDEVIPQQSWIDYASLAFGVTTLHDPSNDTSEIFTHSELQRRGQLVAPRNYSTGTILYGAKGSYRRRSTTSTTRSRTSCA